MANKEEHLIYEKTVYKFARNLGMTKRGSKILSEICTEFFQMGQNAFELTDSLSERVYDFFAETFEETANPELLSFFERLFMESFNMGKNSAQHYTPTELSTLRNKLEHVFNLTNPKYE